MANQLEMAKVNSILTLHQQGHSYRQISQLVGVNRETVARYVQQAEGSKPAKAPPGSSESKPAKAPPGSDDQQGPRGASDRGTKATRRSDCERFRQQILDKLDHGLSVQRIYQDLAEEHGDGPSYYSIRRFVGRLRKTNPLPFRRLESAPGAECQVDFGKGAPIVDAQGHRRRTHVLRVVLSHSRKAYSEAVFRQTTEDFIRCIENALRHFGGVPKIMILDNLRAAVKRADWFDPELNPKIESFCGHYGIAALPTKPYTPRHKGKVERGVGYVQDNGLKGRTFESLEDQNRYLLHWETTIADTRIHGTTRKQVHKIFEEIERPALMPLPEQRFPCFHEGQRRVHRDGHVEVDKAYYSLPPEYLGHTVWVRWDGRTVRVFDQKMQKITMHVQHEPGQFSTQDAHIAREKISDVEQGTAKLLQRASKIGPHTSRWAESMLEDRGITGVRVLVGLLSLTKKHSVKQIDQACEIAWPVRAFRLQSIRDLIKRKAPKQTQFEFLDEHPIIRGLDEYAQFVHTSFTQESR